MIPGPLDQPLKVARICQDAEGDLPDQGLLGAPGAGPHGGDTEAPLTEVRQRVRDHGVLVVRLAPLLIRPV